MKVSDASKIRKVEPKQQAEANQAAPVKEPAVLSERVSVDQSSRLQAALSAVQRNISLSRNAKLEAIEAAVRQGTYRPDPGRIAQEILNDAEITAALQALLQR